MPRKVLLASMDVGGGHRALRDSLAAVLKAADPHGARFGVTRFDSANRTVDTFYSACVRHIPGAQGALWELSERAWLVRAALSACPALVDEAAAALHAIAPDQVIATHPLLVLAFARARRPLARRPLLISALPDYGAPTRFFHPHDPALRPDRFLVLSETARRHLIRTGVHDGAVHLTGFLTDEAFVREGRTRPPRGPTRSMRLRELARAHPELETLSSRRPTVLFLGGSGWAAKTAPVIDRILARPALAEAMNVVVACGRDQAFARKLRARTSGRHGIAVLEFAPRPLLAAVMAAADVPVLGSLAPASLQELLEVGLGPLLVHAVIPGAEPPHLDFLAREALGIFEPDPERMVGLIDRAVRPAPEGAWAALALRFGERARAVRAQSEARASALPLTLERWLGITSPLEPRFAAASA